MFTTCKNTKCSPIAITSVNFGSILVAFPWRLTVTGFKNHHIAMLSTLSANSFLMDPTPSSTTIQW